MAGGARASPPSRKAAARCLGYVPPLCRRTQVPSADRRARTHRTGPARRRRRGARYAQRGGRDDEAVGRGDRLVAVAGSPAANGRHSSRSCHGPGRRSSDTRRAGCVRTSGAAPGDGVLGCAIRPRRAAPGTSRRPVHVGGRTGGGTRSPAIFRRAAQREPVVDAANAVEFVRIYTVGHSTRSLDEFLSLLSANEITLLEDIRVMPASRRYPHFVADALLARGVEVVHILDRTHTELHHLTPFARIEGRRLVYDGNPFSPLLVN